MVRAGEYIAQPVINLAYLLSQPMPRVTHEVAPITKLVVDGDAKRLGWIVAYVVERRGWGRSLRRAVGSALNTIDLDEIMLNLDEPLTGVWTLRELIRYSHPITRNDDRALAYRDAMRGM